MRLLLGLALFLCLFSCSDRTQQKLESFDVAIGPVIPGGWRSEHPEKVQSLSNYKNSKPARVLPGKKVIVLQPVGEFTGKEKKLLNLNAQYLQVFFDLEVRIADPIPDSRIPASERRARDGQLQYRTGFIMDSLLLPGMPVDAAVYMALTATDLYPTEGWNYVFGQAYPKKRVAVSSMNRFRDLELTDDNFQLCLARYMKTTSHEISHMFGLLHCQHAKCVMNGVNHIEEMDEAPFFLCSECHEKLRWNLGFEPKERLYALTLYFRRQHFDIEGELSLKMAESLK